MYIKKRCKIIAEILTIKDFEKFIIDEKLYKFFIKFKDDHINDINEFINNTDSLNYKQVKPSLKKILNYPETMYDKNFLRCMGWDEIDIDSFISERQKKNSQELGKLKKLNPEKYKEKTTTNIEYWLSKGLTEDESKAKLKERQTTFSLSKCVEKYGEVEGNKRFLERQKKWVDTLRNKINYDEIQKTKNPYKYDEKDYNIIIKHSGFKEKVNNVILYCVKEKNIINFVDCVIKKDDIKKYEDLIPYVNSKIIENIFNSNSKEIKNLFYDKINLSQNRQYYGIPVYHNGIRYKSVSEYRVALFLEQNNIPFIYEVNYPNNNMKCDFYLKEKDTYVELYGLLKGKNINKLDKTLSEYQEKMKSKINFCADNNIKLLYDFDYNKLIEKIKNYYEN